MSPAALTADRVFRAGAAAVDITPAELPVRQNGGFLERTADRVVDPLFARALVLDDGSERLTIVVVDSCMVTREVCDEAKALASSRSGIAADRILIAATHTHTAPSVMDFCLGSRADPAYRDSLPPLIARAIETAAAGLRPAYVGWSVTQAPEHTNCRRWITRPDRMQKDPFGHRTVRAMMHPGYQNPDFIGPSGPTDPALSLLSLRSPDGTPIALLANYSMHYFGVGGGLSADYCGRFAAKIGRKITQRMRPGHDSPSFVGILSQGTSGDLHWMDYSRPRREITLDEYTEGLVEIALEAYGKIRYHRWVPVAMAERRLVLRRRVPDAQRLAWARRLLPDPARRPRNRPEVYAQQAIYIHENPAVEIVLQAVRVGGLGITAIPCEVYGITGLKLKAWSPLETTFNMELANGAAGYIPPPEQHALGGYTTWPARTAGLEVEAEPKIVDAVLGLLEVVSGRPRRGRQKTREGVYPEAILSEEPWAYLRMSDLTGPAATDASGHERRARYEGSVAFYLPGPEVFRPPGEETNRAVHLAGGLLRIPVLDWSGIDYSIEMWFWNGLPSDARETTGVLFSSGDERLAISGTRGENPGRLVFGGLRGTMDIPIRTWNHIVFVRRGAAISVWLNGGVRPELEGHVPSSGAGPRRGSEILIGGDAERSATFEGKIDEVAVYDRALRPVEIAAHYRASGFSARAESAPEADEPVTPEPDGSLPRPEVPPLAPAETVKATHVRSGFILELVAAEPLVVDPVAIDWDADGRLWVAEMADYPLGMDGRGAPGGRVRHLEDTDGDGRYDRSVVFLEGVRFPTGIMPWRGGVIVTAAPEIFYAEDTDGDGHADRREVLFTGFLAGNQQLRVNGPRLGLDNWIYCASGGHHAGYGARNKVRSPMSGAEIVLGSRDFRMRPDEGLLDPEAGPSQFGRVRDDWGNWFGVQNSHPLWHYVLRDRQSRRNPYVASPDPRHYLGRRPNPRVYPAKAVQKRFHSFDQSGRFTSACGPSIYRDELLFDREDALRHAFTCEPFHNVVQHTVLTEDGVSFTAERAAADGELDFFASTDRWCRPVMTRTGPDGALWVVDMYRYMIEHPEWLPQVGKDELRPFYRSGDDRGRIYRIYPEGRRPGAIVRLGSMHAGQLVEQLANPNGPVRDTAQRLLVERGDPDSVSRLERVARESSSPLGRLHALSALDGMGALKTHLIIRALADRHAGVVRHALRLAEPRGDGEPQVVAAAVKLAGTLGAKYAKVRLELASSLGAWTDHRAGQTLAALAVRSFRDPWMRAAVLSSALAHDVAVIEAARLAGGEVLDAFFEPLAGQSLESGRYEALALLLAPVVITEPRELDSLHFEYFGRFLDVLHRSRKSLGDLRSNAPDALSACLERAPAIPAAARAVVLDAARPEDDRVAAARLLGREAASRERDVAIAREVLSPQAPSSIQEAAARALGRIRSPDAYAALLSGWASYLPEVRAVVANQLLERATGSLALAKALDEGEIAPASLEATARQRLLRHRSKKVARLAEKIFSAVVNPDREAVVERFRPALERRGDRTRGQQIFEKTCSACHALEPAGRLIGPDLRALTDRSGEGLLISIVDPGRKVDPRYLGYNTILEDGTNLFGLIGGETGNSIVFQLADGSRRSVLRSRIQLVESTGLSFMPTGLEAELTLQDMADLIEYLKRL